MYLYTVERRDVLVNTSHKDREISRGREFFTSRLPEGNLEGQGVQNPREISRSEGDAFPNAGKYFSRECIGKHCPGSVLDNMVPRAQGVHWII